MFTYENLAYRYPGEKEQTISNVNFSIPEGSFVVICGESGSGKSTLLRKLKEDYPDYGYVSQDPSSMIVTDKVYHELAFGMENQGIVAEVMEHRIGEMATFFGMEKWMDRDTMSLSGGEKQLCNLASVLMMRPQVLLLDEPTAQLDPMAAIDFFDMLKRINEQLGVTILMVEQRLEEVMSICDELLILESGNIAFQGDLKNVFAQVRQGNLEEKFISYLPSYMRLFFKYGEGSDCPVTPKEGKKWWQKSNIHLTTSVEKQAISGNSILGCERIYYRYGRNEEDVLEDVRFSMMEGVIYGIVGGNGSGKSTLLKVLAGNAKAYHGKVFCKKKIAYLPQEPKYLFLKDFVRELVTNTEYIQRFGLEELLDRHPYDMSGGQVQRLAFAYLAQEEADVYLFDEPTKGLDPEGKRLFGKWIQELRAQGKGVLIVSHDVEFAADYCDNISMCFHKKISQPQDAVTFFSNNYFYTTSFYRVVREQYPNCISERYIVEEKR